MYDFLGFVKMLFTYFSLFKRFTGIDLLNYLSKHHAFKIFLLKKFEVNLNKEIVNFLTNLILFKIR